MTELMAFAIIPIYIIGFIIIVWIIKKLLSIPKFDNAANNALLAEHCLSLIELVGENPFVNELKTGIVSAWGHSRFPNLKEEDIYEEFNHCTRFEQLNILAMAFNEINQDPMLPGEVWLPVKNLCICVPGSDDELHLKAKADRLKWQHGVDIQISQERLNIYDWDKKLIPEKKRSKEKIGDSAPVEDNLQKTTIYGHGILGHQEIKPILDDIDNYISQFGDRKPKSITLNSYEWAVMDLNLRLATNNIASLHTYVYDNLIIRCKSNRCYCHHFLDDPEVREIVKVLSNYLESMGNKSPERLPIDANAKQKLNNRFEYFFDGVFNLDSKPRLATHIIRVTGQELYKTNYA